MICNHLTFSLLFKNLTKAEAQSKEQELIALYKTVDEEFGYNLTIGGEGGTKYLTPEESRKAKNKNSQKYYASHREHYKEYRKKIEKKLFKKRENTIKNTKKKF